MSDWNAEDDVTLKDLTRLPLEKMNFPTRS